MNKNEMTITGIVAKEFEYSHNIGNEEFYHTTVMVGRYSGTLDEISVVVKKDTAVSRRWEKKYVLVSGTVRSHSKYEDGKKRLYVSLKADSIKECDVDKVDSDRNDVEVLGKILHQPSYRETPTGKRISDFVLILKDETGRQDCVPCITWEENADTTSALIVGTMLHVTGRMQSREYKKKTKIGEISRTVHEVSVKKMEVVDDEEGDD